jgi:hypothetical protein
LDELKALHIARQIDDESQQWSDALAQSLCEAFYMVSRQDTTGYECVHYLMADIVPTVTIDIGDIIPGTLGKMEDPRPEYVVVEPKINYGYDYASKTFRKSLAITGVADNSSWSSDLTPGFSGTDGESLWNICRVNYLKYLRFNDLQQSLSEQYWIPDYDTALWKMTKVLEWQQKKRFSFSIYYTLGRTLYVGQQINIQFPNETDDLVVRALINGVRRNKNQNRVELNLTLLDEINSEFYYSKYQAADDAATAWQQTDGATASYQEAG